MAFLRIVPKITRLFKTPILKNYMFMSIYQGINFIIPLVILPFVISVVGLEKYGLVAFSYSFVSYFLVITDYGFNLSATREISLNRDNPARINAIFNKVISSKILLLLGCSLIFTTLVFSIPFFRKEAALHLLGFSIVAAHTFLPIWLFQGLQEMKFIAITNSISKILSLIFIFVFITDSSQYIYVNFLLGVGGIIACAGSFWFIVYKYRINFKFIPVKRVIVELRSGYSLFVSAFSVNIYVNSNAFILGLLVSPAVLTYYSVAEKVLLALKQVTSVFSQVIYPHVCLLASESFNRVLGFFKKALVPFVGLLVVACTGIFLMAPFIAHYFLNEYNTPAVKYIQYLSIVPIIIALDIPAFQMLLAYNRKREYSIILSSACVISIILNFIFAYSFGAAGTIISIIITELYVTILLSYSAYRRLHIREK